MVYKVDEAELLHNAGYRWELSPELAEELAQSDERDFKALMLSEEFHPTGLKDEDLDMFPKAVWRHVVNLARKVDASARKGGPTVPTVLLRARTAK